MSNRKRSELTRGDRRRNDRLSRLRAIVRPELAIVGIDLASAKQAAVVTDHESITLGKRMFDGSPWVVDEIIEWAWPIAREAGFVGVVIACEPTGHRWKPLLDRTRARGIDLVCVNPMLVARAREGEDFTKNRSDFSDAGHHRSPDGRASLPRALPGRGALVASAPPGGAAQPAPGRRRGGPSGPA